NNIERASSINYGTGTPNIISAKQGQIMVIRNLSLLRCGEQRAVRDNKPTVPRCECAVGMLTQGIHSNLQSFGQEPVGRFYEDQMFASTFQIGVDSLREHEIGRAH